MYGDFSYSDPYANVDRYVELWAAVIATAAFDHDFEWLRSIHARRVCVLIGADADTAERIADKLEGGKATRKSKDGRGWAPPPNTRGEGKAVSGRKAQLMNALAVVSSRKLRSQQAVFRALRREGVIDASGSRFHTVASLEAELRRHGVTEFDEFTFALRLLPK